jgi:hypothetical protein
MKIMGRRYDRLSSSIERIRGWIISALWRSGRIARKYCWANAVLWQMYPETHDIFKAVDPKCYYCLSCKTDAEIKAYQQQ